MATCPHCGTSEMDAFTVGTRLVAKPLGSYSISGTSMKVSAIEVAELKCRCGWSILGHINGEHFNGEPTTQVFPPDRRVTGGP